MRMRRPIIKNQPPFEVLKPFLCELQCQVIRQTVEVSQA